jgi:hypothetical protein
MMRWEEWVARTFLKGQFMKTSNADVKTANAVSYLRQLCRHWGHRFPVEFNDERGVIQLPSAACALQSSPETLSVRLEMPDDADQARIEKVVEEHLQRFGFRETLVFDWVR